MVASLGHQSTSHNQVIEGYELETARRGSYLCNYSQLKYGTQLHANTSLFGVPLSNKLG